MSLEQVYEDIGGFSWFQCRVVILISLIKPLTAWSMMMMTFAGLVPDFDCLPARSVPYGSGDIDLSYNDSLNACTLNSSSCSQYVFHGNANSVVSEWNLVCDRKWVKSTIISVQMAGVLVGALLGGQCSDVFGRRYTNYGFFVLHTVLNVVAGLSTSWQMFVVLRFLIGFCIGSLFVTMVPYATEFLPLRWRPLVAAVPMWPLGLCLFALAAWILKDWAKLHLGCAILSVPVLFTYFLIPESPRWLAVTGRLKQAQLVVEKMAVVNGRDLPAYTLDVLQEISAKANKSKLSRKRYSYLDIFNTFAIAKASIIFGFQWFSISIIFYGISFGVTSFSGNLYLNLALVAIVEMPSYIATFFLVNKFGRRLTVIGYLAVGSAAAFACIGFHYKGSGGGQWSAINILSLLAKLAISGCWDAQATWVVESYPTIIRGAGYGFVNMTARVGAIIVPFTLDLDDSFVTSFFIAGVLQVVCLVLALFLAETKGQILADNVTRAITAITARTDDLKKSVYDGEEEETRLSKGPNEAENGDVTYRDDARIDTVGM